MKMEKPRAAGPRGVRDKPTIFVAYPHGEINPMFHRSMIRAYMYDAHGDRNLVDGAHFQIHTTNLPHARNQCVREFLDTECDYLWFIDTDEPFDPTVPIRLLHVADPVERPIVGALVYSYDVNNTDQKSWPTVWSWSAEGIPRRWSTTPRNTLIRCDATGTGCVLIHRSAFEKMAASPSDEPGKTWAETSWPWFRYSEWTSPEGKPDVMGEDLTFMVRAGQCGIPVHVDTSISVGHMKPINIDEQWHYDNLPFERRLSENYVVIPVRDRLDLTKQILRQLQEQGHYSAIFVYDNGSGPETKKWLARQTIAEVFDAPGASIHQMWNAGIAESLARWPKANVAILNNDLRLGDQFLERLANALRGVDDQKLAAVAPVYDGRTLEAGEVQPVRGISAGRTDGSGGLPGFAFMVKAELFAAGLPMFDEQFEYWFGDNDWTLELDQLGAWYGIAGGVTVEHLDGGSQTDRKFTAETEPKKLRDRERFRAKWEPRGVQFPDPVVIDPPLPGADVQRQGAE